MENILNKTESYVVELLYQSLGADYLFHNLNLTLKAVERAKELLKNYQKGEVDKTAILIAIWFLNTGFTEGSGDHKAGSSQLAKKFLEVNNFDAATTDHIASLIVAAWSSKNPETESEAIVKDIHSSYYASDNLKELLELYRLEQQNLGYDPPGPHEWNKRYIEILRTEHRFYTDHAMEKWQPAKKENVISLIKALQKLNKTEKKEKLKVQLKDQSPERAIQSLYRTQLRNHLKLSDIADTKANILLSVNAIIISLLIANLIPRLGDPVNSYLIYPTVIFVIFSIASMIMSVLATRPKIENKELVDDAIEQEETNYLFFGNFHALTPVEFKSKIRDIIQSKEIIYDSLSMDLYYLGKVLKAKYQLLKWTYTVFMIGIILSVIAFAIALKYFGMDQELLDAVTPTPEE